MAERKKPAVPQTPLASASWSCMVVATVTITTPNNASADIKATTTNVVFISKGKKGRYHLRLSASKFQYETFL